MGKTGKTKGEGFSLRVHEIYNELTQKGKWEESPAGKDGLLIFVISAARVSNGIMLNVADKHVGIHFGGQVYHYSNTKKEVVVQTVAEFNRHYKGNDISLFYGAFP